MFARHAESKSNSDEKRFGCFHDKVALVLHIRKLACDANGQGSKLISLHETFWFFSVPDI